MLRILINRKAGKNNKKIDFNSIKKKFPKQYLNKKIYNVEDVNNYDHFFDSINFKDVIVLVGGDGTYNHFINGISKTPNQKIFFMRSGTGNDFFRSISKRNKIILVNDYIKHLPKVNINGLDLKYLNGIGIGLDGYVGNQIKNKTSSKNAFTFFYYSIVGILKFKTFILNIDIDGNNLKYNKTWFCSIMFGSTFGRGMKVAPHATREKELHAVIVKDCPRWLLLFIFPFIYFGKHIWFKKYVDIIEGNDLELLFKSKQYCQIDGEIIEVKKSPIRTYIWLSFQTYFIIDI